MAEMAVRDAVRELVSRVTYNRGYDGLDGLDPLRRMLWSDADGAIADCLEQEIRHAPTKVRGGLAFLLGTHYLEVGSLDAIRALYRSADAEVTAAVLGSLTGDPTASPAMGPGVVALAVEGTSHRESSVRVSACSALMNQCAWGVDASGALGPVLELLEDADTAVRQGAAYAVGNFARSTRYDLAPHIVSLAGSLSDQSVHVRTAAAWAIWKLSGRRDIARAVPSLVRVLESSDDYDGPRRNAAGALLSFARKSTDNRALVRQLSAGSHLDTSKKEVIRFLQQLSIDR